MEYLISSLGCVGISVIMAVSVCVCVSEEVWRQTCSPAWDSPMMKRSPGPSAAKIKGLSELNICANQNNFDCAGVCH